MTVDRNAGVWGVISDIESRLGGGDATTLLVYSPSIPDLGQQVVGLGALSAEGILNFAIEATLYATQIVDMEIDAIIGDVPTVATSYLSVQRVRDDAGLVVAQTSDVLTATASGPVTTGQITFDTWTADTTDAERATGDGGITLLTSGTFRIIRSIGAP